MNISSFFCLWNSTQGNTLYVCGIPILDFASSICQWYFDPGNTLYVCGIPILDIT